MKMLIAGGGTGGHLFPGMAVGEEFLARDPGNEVLFVGTVHGIENKILPATTYPYRMIRSEPIMGQGILRKIRAMMILPISYLDAWEVLRGFNPDFVLGTGGYVSGPMVVAASRRKLPTAIHEQNSSSGTTNKILGKRVDKVFLTFEAARSEFAEADAAGKVVITGNPIRRFIRDALMQKAGEERKANGLRILIVGGSQGAHRLNIMVCSAFGLLGELKGKVKITHQSGDVDWYDVAAAYARSGFRAKVFPFIDDMAAALIASDLIISRAGAGAIAEILLSGRPSILVPFPYAAGDHQTINAQSVVQAGAALMVKDEISAGKLLADSMLSLIKDPEKSREMGQKARALARPDAAKMIVDHGLELAGSSSAVRVDLSDKPKTRNPKPKTQNQR